MRVDFNRQWVGNKLAQLNDEGEYEYEISYADDANAPDYSIRYEEINDDDLKKFIIHTAREFIIKEIKETGTSAFWCDEIDEEFLIDLSDELKNHLGREKVISYMRDIIKSYVQKSRYMLASRYMITFEFNNRNEMFYTRYRFDPKEGFSEFFIHMKKKISKYKRNKFEPLIELEG